MEIKPEYLKPFFSTKKNWCTFCIITGRYSASHNTLKKIYTHNHSAFSMRKKKNFHLYASKFGTSRRLTFQIGLKLLYSQALRCEEWKHLPRTKEEANTYTLLRSDSQHLENVKSRGNVVRFTHYGCPFYLRLISGAVFLSQNEL